MREHLNWRARAWGHLRGFCLPPIDSQFIRSCSVNRLTPQSGHRWRLLEQRPVQFLNRARRALRGRHTRKKKPDGTGVFRWRLNSRTG
jgi:hypothetical protein